MSDISVGLVGYGLGGSIFHAPLITAVPRLRLVSVATSRREQVARELPGVQVAKDVETLLADSSIDLVVVASPSGTHFDVASKALKAGKHVVVDKPFTTSVAEADALVALGAGHGRLLSAYQNRRWDNDFLTVRQVLANGWLGSIYNYEAHYDRFRMEIKARWKEEPGAGGGTTFDLGPHLVDQALCLFGMPRAVTAEIFPQRPGSLVDDYFHIMLDYGRLRAVVHASTVVCHAGPRFAIHGDGGSFLKCGLDPQEDQLKAGKRPSDPEWGLDAPEYFGELVQPDGSRRRIETLRGGYQHYYEGVASALLDGAPLPVTAAEARSVIVVIEAARRSAAEGRKIALA